MVVSLTVMPSPHEALRGRKKPVAVSPRHFVNGHSTAEPFPVGFDLAMFAMGCFWGAERMFWSIDGVYSTQAGLAAVLRRTPPTKRFAPG